MKDELRRAFDASTEAPHPSLRSALRARLEAGPPDGPPQAWRMVVATALVVGIVGLALVGGLALLPRGGGNLPAPAAASSATPTALPTATPPATAASPVPSPTNTWIACSQPPSYSGGAASMANVTDVRVGTSAGYDRFVIQFDGPVPAYSVTSQDSAAFMQDGTGKTLQLRGGAGVKIVVRGASGTDLNGNQTYPGAVDFTPGYPALQEARQVGDFERVFSWGLGIAQPSCLKVTVLTGPDRLVVDVLKA
jgi:hypothetical protein